MPDTVKIVRHWDEVATAQEIARPVARIPHTCECGDTIEVGERYLRVVWAYPWTMIADDVDDEGRPLGSPASEWIVSLLHDRCVG